MSSSSPPSQASVFEPIAGSGQACAVKLPVFEGPLDLLLHLIRQNELDITELSLARIAEQYLEYVDLMRDMHLEVAAEYLVMAATLAWIKSRLLLPSDETEEEEEGDPRAALVARLLEYQRFKEAAEELGARPLLGRDVFEVRGPEPEPLPEGERELEVGLFELLQALRDVLRDAARVELVHELVSEPITVRERMQVVMEALEGAETLELVAVLAPRGGGPVTRALVVATFLAVLELTRVAALRVYQGVGERGVPEGPIRLRRNTDAEAPDWRVRIAEFE